MHGKFLIPLCLLVSTAALAQVQPRFESTPSAPSAQSHGALDSNETLFTVLAAVNVGGYDAEIENPSGSPVRKAVRDHLQSLKLPIIEEIRQFVHAHHQTDPGAELGQYISYALVVEGPPDFGWHYRNIVPPDVEGIQDFTPLLVRFYREANIAELWKQVEPQYDQAIEQLSRPLANAILQVNSYLRNDTGGYLGRRFQIYVDLLGAPNQVQTRSYLDDYYVVVTPASEPPVKRIRFAYMHYLLDTLPLKYSDKVKEKHALGDYALGSPVLEEQFKTDFMLMTSECLIKAVESRLDRNPGEAIEAMREGYVLTPAMAELLASYEAQEESMRLYFPTLIDGIDLKREEARLDHIDFLKTRSDLTIRHVEREVAPALTGVDKTLDDAEKLYLARDVAHAREAFLRALRETDVKSKHARAYYGLARISLLEKDPEKADELFKAALEQDPDAETKSWSLLYLGRLADSQGWRDEAIESYKAALAVPGVSDTVRQAAEQGLKSAFTNTKK